MSSHSSNLQALRGWYRRTQKLAAARAVRAGQAVIAAGMKRRCPVGVTHDLVNSIEATPPVATPGGVHGRVEVTSGYALPVEYGTRDQAAHPFVRPTADADGGAALRAMTDELRKS